MLRNHSMRNHYMRDVLAAAFCVAAAIAAMAAGETGAVSDGETTFNNACRTCHSLKAGDNRLGPHLHGIIGKAAASAEGFAYSAALKGTKMTWDEATLDKFIANPESVVPGNNMKPFTGISDKAQRDAIIEFLKSRG